MAARVAVPCMVPFSGDRLRTPSGRHRWREEVYARLRHPAGTVAWIDVEVMADRCVFCRNWRGDVIEHRGK